MASLKVLIIGGGIAGPALAHWLAKTGAKITLIERSSSMRASGQQLDLRAQGVTMMKKMGIEAAVRAASVKEPGTQLIDLNGQTQAFFPARNDGSGKQGITSEFEIMRGDLVQILYRLTENLPNVQHLFDSNIESITQDAESDAKGMAHVRFQDGREEDFDLVVGADGTGSKTRRLIMGPDAPDPRHRRGGYIGYFSILNKPGDSDRLTVSLLPGSHISRVIATRKDCPELTRVYMLMTGKDVAVEEAYQSGELERLKTALADLYQDGGWECKRFMEALRHSPEANDLYFTPLEEVRLPEGSWSKGRVVLLGDAAHSQTANGYGTTWGLVGAYVLAGEISALYQKDPSSPTAAVVQGAKNYETKFRPIATAMHGNDNDFFESLKAPRSKFGIWLVYAFVKIAAHLRLDRLPGLSDKTAKWPLPEYPELQKGQK